MSIHLLTVRGVGGLWDNEITPDLGTDYDAYSYVSSIGWPPEPPHTRKGTEPSELDAVG